jgi:GNAT superfamily N-acetyltransferase
MLALGFPLIPEYAAQLRRTDPRPFPCLSVCAVEAGMVIGHVGIYRQPMLTSEGREDVGGIWAASTHPQYSARGVVSRLLAEAHLRMRAAGLRFSTLSVDRYCEAYRLYCRNGYEDLKIWATAVAGWETAHQPTRLRAEPAGDGGYDIAEQVFAEVAGDYLGFACRQTPFTRLRDEVKVDDIYLLWENNQPVGYALASVERSVLTISNLLIKPGVDPAEAVAAVASRLRTAYIQVKISRPLEIASLKQAGYQVAYPDWSAFMLKPLFPGVTVEDARRLFAIGTDRFLISWLDTS